VFSVTFLFDLITLATLALFKGLDLAEYSMKVKIMSADTPKETDQGLDGRRHFLRNSLLAAAAAGVARASVAATPANGPNRVAPTNQPVATTRMPTLSPGGAGTPAAPAGGAGQAASAQPPVATTRMPTLSPGGQRK
jgi:hypothetical protein